MDLPSDTSEIVAHVTCVTGPYLYPVRNATEEFSAFYAVAHSFPVVQVVRHGMCQRNQGGLTQEPGQRRERTVKGLMSATTGVNSSASVAMSTAPTAGTFRKASRSTNRTGFHSPGSPNAAPEPVSSDSEALRAPATTENAIGDPGRAIEAAETEIKAVAAMVALMRMATAGGECCQAKVVVKDCGVNGAGGRRASSWPEKSCVTVLPTDTGSFCALQSRSQTH